MAKVIIRWSNILFIAGGGSVERKRGEGGVMELILNGYEKKEYKSNNPFQWIVAVQAARNSGQRSYSYWYQFCLLLRCTSTYAITVITAYTGRLPKSDREMIDLRRKSIINTQEKG